MRKLKKKNEECNNQEQQYMRTDRNLCIFIYTEIWFNDGAKKFLFKTDFL